MKLSSYGYGNDVLNLFIDKLYEIPEVKEKFNKEKLKAILLEEVATGLFSELFNQDKIYNGYFPYSLYPPFHIKIDLRAIDIFKKKIDAFKKLPNLLSQYLELPVRLFNWFSDQFLEKYSVIDSTYIGTFMRNCDAKKIEYRYEALETFYGKDILDLLHQLEFDPDEIYWANPSLINWVADRVNAHIDSCDIDEEARKRIKEESHFLDEIGQQLSGKMLADEEFPNIKNTSDITDAIRNTIIIKLKEFLIKKTQKSEAQGLLEPGFTSPTCEQKLSANPIPEKNIIISPSLAQGIHHFSHKPSANIKTESIESYLEKKVGLQP